MLDADDTAPPAGVDAVFTYVVLSEDDTWSEEATVTVQLPEGFVAEPDPMAMSSAPSSDSFLTGPEETLSFGSVPSSTESSAPSDETNGGASVPLLEDETDTVGGSYGETTDPAPTAPETSTGDESTETHTPTESNDDPNGSGNTFA